ncbi:MAG: NADH-quinone oxidoreductase subunit J family protein [Thermoplasmatota archaeon]
MALPGLNLFDTLPATLQYVALFGSAGVTFLLAYAAADSEDARMGLGGSVVALGVAAVAGFALWDVSAAFIFLSYALFLVAGLQLFYLKRRIMEIPLWLATFAVAVVLQAILADVTTAGVLAIGSFAVFSALKVVQSKELVHATVWLAGVLAAIAGIFLTLNAEFLAWVQILIYVGAVVTLVLFTVMLTLPNEESHLDDIEVPPGVTIESVADLQSDMPAFSGAGPMKNFVGTNPYHPVHQPADLTGVAMADNVFAGSKTAKERIRPKEKGAGGDEGGSE